MVKKLLSFLLGAALASAWWQAAMFSYGDGPNRGLQYLVAAFVTAVSIMIIGLNCYNHLDDK